jgi:hypothetical protein
MEFTPGPRFEYLPFDSTLYALAAEANPKSLGLVERTDWYWGDQDRDWTHARHAEADASLQGWTPLVVPQDAASLQVLRGMGDQFAERGVVGSFAVPADAFVHTQVGADVLLSAQLADGSPLPGWARFDARSGKFEFAAPAGFSGELRIKLTARDAQGREAATLFRFHVGDKRQEAGRAGLSEKLRDATQRQPGKRAVPVAAG